MLWVWGKIQSDLWPTCWVQMESALAIWLSVWPARSVRKFCFSHIYIKGRMPWLSVGEESIGRMIP